MCSSTDPVITFWDQTHKGSKGFRDGTHRARSPAETFEHIRPYLAVAGVTRIADVTGLDNVGVPTTLAIRPNALTIACSSGKGISREQAFVSGGAEAIELHAAETATLPSIRASYTELERDHTLPPESDLPLSLHSLFNREWAFHWHEAWDLANDATVMVPLAIVGMSRSEALLSSLGAFQVSSNGLGGGNTFLEAVTSAIYETIERDAVACHSLAAHLTRHKIPVVPRSLLDEYRLVQGVLEACDRAGISCVVYDCTLDTCVPAYSASIFEEQDHGVGVVRGSGAHLDPEIAILRAVTEALQARLNFIAGSRDDIFRSAFRRYQADSSVIPLIQSEAASAPVAHRRASTAGDTFQADVRALVSNLRQAGLAHAALVDLTPADCPIHVVRVIVPGLEGYMHHGYRPGRRALSFVEKVRAECV